MSTSKTRPKSVPIKDSRQRRMVITRPVSAKVASSKDMNIKLAKSKPPVPEAKSENEKKPLQRVRPSSASGVSVSASGRQTSGVNSFRPVSADSSHLKREKVPVKIQTLELDLTFNKSTKTENKKSTAKKQKNANYVRSYASCVLPSSSSSSECSPDCSLDPCQNSFIYFDLFDPKRLTLGEIKKKYRDNKNKPKQETDLFKLIPQTYYDQIDDEYEATLRRKPTSRPRPIKPTSGPVKTILSSNYSNSSNKSKGVNNVRFKQDSDSGNESGSEGSIKIIMPKCKKI